MDPIITVKNLTKVYPNGFKANDNLTLTAHKGEIVGLIGPNGAGKTTLIRQILGLLQPTEGEINLLGQNPIKAWNKLRGLVGYVPQMPLYYPSLTVKETVNFVLRFKGIKGKELLQKGKEALALVGLDKLTDQFGYQLSTGSMRLLLLAMALCQDPPVLILDEPTSMLDVVNRSHVQELLADQKEKFILVASHDMNEVRTLCDKVYLMVGGKFIAQGTPQEISTLIKLPVEINFMPGDAPKAEEFVTAARIPFKKEGPIFYVSFEELGQGIKFIDDLYSSSGLRYLYVEAPSIEKAVLHLVQGD